MSEGALIRPFVISVYCKAIVCVLCTMNANHNYRLYLQYCTFTVSVVTLEAERRDKHCCVLFFIYPRGLKFFQHINCPLNAHFSL